MGYLIMAGPFVLVVGLLGAVIGFRAWKRAPEPKRHPSASLYWVGVGLIGGVMFVGGAAVGILAACSSATSGNLCGLTGIFGVGPWLAGLNLAAYAWWWWRRACRPLAG
jgi:hypothetical protein